jgi:hypothetical protein
MTSRNKFRSSKDFMAFFLLLIIDTISIKSPPTVAQKDWPTIELFKEQSTYAVLLTVKVSLT